MPYDMKHMENWDFAEMCESPAGRLTGEAALFLQSLHPLARDSVRMQLLWETVERGHGDWDGTFVTLKGPYGRGEATGGEADAYLVGLRGSRLSLARLRFAHRVHFEIVESLRREYRRDGRLRLTRLPDDPHGSVLAAFAGQGNG